MMGDEIRPPSISVPRRVREVTREDREENEERFRKKLSELTQDTEADQGRAKRVPAPVDRPAEDATPADADEAQSPLGRNIDLRT